VLYPLLPHHTPGTCGEDRCKHRAERVGRGYVSIPINSCTQGGAHWAVDAGRRNGLVHAGRGAWGRGCRSTHMGLSTRIDTRSLICERYVPSLCRPPFVYKQCGVARDRDASFCRDGAQRDPSSVATRSRIKGWGASAVAT